MNSPKAKRVTVKLKCPNPLFEEWLVTWRDQAAAKESKMQYSFNLALKSLRMYPIPLNSGRECKILKGFGDKLCKMLDDKLKDYKKNGGSNTTHYTLPCDDNLHKPPKKTLGSSTKKPNRAQASTSGTKQYVPQYGSGGYAILVTLYAQSLDPNYPGFLTKAEIIAHGRGLVNSSFTKPDPGSRYTAWSSMRTLLTKELVSKRSNPAKFSLTEEGRVLAKKLYENDDNNFNPRDQNSKTLDTIPKNGTFAVYSGTNNSEEIIEIPSELPETCFDDNYYYSDNELMHLDAPNSPKIGNEILFEKFASSSSFSNNYKETDEVNQRTKKPMQTNSFSNTHSLNSPKIVNEILFEKFASSSSISSYKEIEEANQRTKKALQKNSSSTIVSSSNSTKASTKRCLKKHTSSSSVTSTQSNVNLFESFVMPPYGFDIILYVDNQETSGSSNSQSDEILLGLSNFGIKHEVKNLKVGDFTWICRDRLTGKELILPYIIERKRMDDFAHSIRDKRYHEQKFRLKRSGIENLTYLVESYGRNEHVGLPLQTLRQAATNTAIQENFFIKFTENMKETVEYLANFSKILVNMFKSKTLASCPKNDIQPLNINDDIISLMAFKEFNQSSVKNKRMKVTDLFVKMLIQIKGLSVERALAITQKYPTALLLKEAYNCNPDTIGEKLLSNIKYGTHGKSIGAALSKTVHQVFTKLHY